MSLWEDLARADLWLTKVAEGEDADGICSLFLIHSTPHPPQPLFVLLGEKTGTVGGV